jgi:acyl-CoA thioesterase II
MGDVGSDTAVVGSSGSFAADLSRDWDIWGPNGGYVAAVGLRAIGASTDFGRPASFSCHFLGVARYDQPVSLEVTSLRKAKRAESLRVSMRQGDAAILEGIAWVIGDVGGLQHDAAVMPDVPKPHELKSIEELLSKEQLESGPPYPFWLNFDERPTKFLPQEEWLNRPPGDPVWRNWLRFRPTATYDDPFIEAARFLIALDVCMWPAATSAYAAGRMTHIAPSLDLFASFHRLDTRAEWLLVDGFAPFAGDGLVGGQSRVWSEDGSLLASGGQQMLCRPVM